MTAVFVHGVPDTERVWHAVIPRLGTGNIVTLRLPGFGAPLPDGFDPTKDAYAAWLVEQIEAQDGPVDLVGHDWGALLVLRAACLRPELVRSWTMGAGPLDPEYVWHKAAQTWQTPEVGEQAMARTTPEAMEKALTAAGVPADDARAAAAHVDETMKRCILRLYRSAIKVGEQWTPDLARLTAPGLILWGELDPFAPPVWGERLAARTGAKLVVFPGCSHWWPLQRAADVATLLTQHWDGAGQVKAAGR
jgi:pimeloyl-ACP methyl ester carboxylesterase